MREKRGRMRRRRSDNCRIVRFWDRVNPYWHICTSVFIAFVSVSWWVKDVNGYSGQIAANAADIVILKEKVGDIAVIKQRVEDIANYMGVPRKGRK